MPRILLVPDLPMEHWPSMDRYAQRLALALEREAPELVTVLAGKIGDLTVDRPDGGSDGVRHSDPHPFPKLPPRGTQELRRYYNRYWVYPRRIRRKKADLLHVLDHSYSHVLRAKKRVPSVITVHDLLPVLTVQRKATSFRERIRNRLLETVLGALREADGWIVATEWLRHELAEWLGDAGRITIIPFGVDEAFFVPPKHPRSFYRRRWEIPESAFVVLHVGSVGTRKNFGAVVASVDGLRSAGVNAWLLQVGGVLTAEQQADIEARGLHEFVCTLALASEADLRAAYRAADVLLFPSHYEGFGFPVLEAMASEIPVVTSGAGGLTEVAADAAIVVGGREVEPYISALKRIVDDKNVGDQLVKRGAERARRFRWAETARKTADLYRRFV